jgi:hypothetical protein
MELLPTPVLHSWTCSRSTEPGHTRTADVGAAGFEPKHTELELIWKTNSHVASASRRS